MAIIRPSALYIEMITPQLMKLLVVKTALEHNAAAMIITHNHPSGNPEPSQADIHLTTRLKEALALVDVRVLDHIIVGTDGCYSLVENGNM